MFNLFHLTNNESPLDIIIRSCIFLLRPYNIRRNDEIIDFFNNFEDYLSEEAMWQISETIKPRGKK